MKSQHTRFNLKWNNGNDDHNNSITQIKEAKKKREKVRSKLQWIVMKRTGNKREEQNQVTFSFEHVQAFLLLGLNF